MAKAVAIWPMEYGHKINFLKRHKIKAVSCVIILYNIYMYNVLNIQILFLKEVKWFFL
jgi:hypothetical protein